MLKLNYFSHADLLLRRIGLRVFASGVVVLFLFQATAYAHNKVVVIPMAGDDVPAELTPTTPIANDNPDQTNYTIELLTVFDKTTQLDWQREDDNQARSQQEAVEYCSTLNLNGHTDWRLPTVNELLSIVDYGQVGVKVDPVVFLNTTTGSYSTSLISSSSSSEYWIVRFNDGETFTTTFNSQVRCVRTRPLN